MATPPLCSNIASEASERAARMETPWQLLMHTEDAESRQSAVRWLVQRLGEDLLTMTLAMYLEDASALVQGCEQLPTDRTGF